ncbi:MAG TPA: LPS export ABC transporter periplasmic protein LptC [Candidatus Acidoferrum sp.]|nr:LPS export ABC transporter periplasmic protein LptC [Candidatus Acidoferrum sp.]
MKRSEAARYAQWSAAAALLLAVLTAGVYVQRGWKARKERKNAPKAAAANVSRQSNGLAFSKVEGNRKVFTVEASTSTDFKDRDLTELEAVVITIFGNNGDRHDVIHTQSCQYGKTDGNVVCSGAVRMELESATEAARASSAEAGAAPPQVMHVETRAVTFNRASGTAATSQPVSFDFPNGSGQGVGMEYRSEAGAVKLLKDVRLNLRPPANAASSAKAPGKSQTHAKSSSQATATSGAANLAAGQESQEVTVTGSSLDFDRTSHKMHVHGPAKAESKTTRLTAGELAMDLDAQFRAQTLVASGNLNGEQPKIVSAGKGGEMDVDADQLTAEFAPEGWVKTVVAEGSVKGVRLADAERDDATSQTATIAMWPRVNEVKELNLRGDVALKSLASASGDSKVLHTESLRMEFSGGQPKEGSRPLKAETLSAGRMEWTEMSAASLSPSAPTKNATAAKVKSRAANAAANPPTPAHTTLAADKLQMQFDALGKPKLLQADGHVQTERTMAGKPTQTATADRGTAQLLAGGGWSQMDLNGGVKLREAERNGQGDHAVFRREEQTATLTGHAFARDATTETSAPRIVFAQNSGDIHAEGGVRSTDFSGHASAVQLAPVPVHITSDQLQGNSQTGRALYTGHARMWQGESVLEADSIELLRETRVMNALGNIRAVFPQTAAAPPGGAVPSATSAMNIVSSPATTPAAKAAVEQSVPKKSPLWHVTAQSLMYNDAESRAHLEHDVLAVSADQRMRAPVVDLYFTRGASIAPSNGAAGAQTASLGPQQISRAVGTGGTTVEQGARKAVAERGVYTASDGKFVMSGGSPTLFDASEGTTTGRQLTFFLADDTIIVDSETGSRVLTRHRVEN